VAYGRPARVPLHQGFGLAAMRKPEDFRDRAQVAVRIDQLLAVGVERRNARGKLTAVLDVQEHPRNQPGGMIGTLLRTKRATVARQMIHGGDAAFVMEFAHATRLSKRQAEPGQEPARTAKQSGRGDKAIGREKCILGERRNGYKERVKFAFQIERWQGFPAFGYADAGKIHRKVDRCPSATAFRIFFVLSSSRDPRNGILFGSRKRESTKRECVGHQLDGPQREA
jgi:hypothetical protein